MKQQNLLCTIQRGRGVGAKETEGARVNVGFPTLLGGDGGGWG